MFEDSSASASGSLQPWRVTRCDFLPLLIRVPRSVSPVDAPYSTWTQLYIEVAISACVRPNSLISGFHKRRFFKWVQIRRTFSITPISNTSRSDSVRIMMGMEVSRFNGGAEKNAQRHRQ
jgi:hypothetical protein